MSKHHQARKPTIGRGWRALWSAVPLLVILATLFVVPPVAIAQEASGDPILVITSSTNPFTGYLAEILKAEGLNEFTQADASTVTPAILAQHDVAILGDMTLSGPQVDDLTDWVQAGGNLIAMHPDPQLAGLLGLASAGGTLANAYLRVDTSSAPGAGIVNQTIQFHGAADLYSLSGASAIATLYSDTTTATTNPAVTLHNVGANGGQAAAFTYDLARSVVYTRQGNPAWAQDDRDGDGIRRPNDLFFGAKAGDVQPDWVNLDKVSIPQADEQQRLLGNLILRMDADRKPLPKFWYFPRDERAVVVMTGDDHGGSGTVGRMNGYLAASPSNCSVADWECVRSSSYIYPGTNISDAQAASLTAAGFEIGLHPNSNDSDWTPEQLDAYFDSQLAALAQQLPSIPAPDSSRMHRVAWSDWATMPKVELDHGIRLDDSYYFFGGSWVQNRPGFMTGSGIPMRFADLDGTAINVFQATTQMTDESGQSYPFTIDSLLDKALGPEGYYGVFTANMHTDNAVSSGSDAIVASAQAHGVPVVSGRQMLTWLDGRDASSFQSISRDGTTLSFTIDAGAGANGLRAMLPASSVGNHMASLTRDGNPATFTTETIKGVEYAVFPAVDGVYSADYPLDTTGPVITNVTAVGAPDGTATVTWSTNEPSDSRVDYGTTPSVLDLNATDPSLVTSHSIELSGLNPSTTYHYRVTSQDEATNSSTSPAPPAAPASFTAPSAVLTDTTTSDFSAGTIGTDTYVSESANGEVTLRPTAGAEFSGTSVPAGWEGVPFGPGGTVVVSGGRVTVNAARVNTQAPLFGPGHSLEFIATFLPGDNAHIGFGITFQETPFAIFSTSPAGNALSARTNDGSNSINNPIAGNFMGSPHRYRIDWGASQVVFSIDGQVVDTQNVTIPQNMRPVAASNGGQDLTVDWMRMSPYSPSGTFLSRVFDAAGDADWGAMTWTTGTPAGTTVAMSVRTGNTAVPDASWSPFVPVANPGDTIGATSRFIQYRAQLATTDPDRTPELRDVSIGYVAGEDTTAPTVTNVAPADGATDVATDTDVTATFSEGMNAGTIDPTTFTLTRAGAQGPVAATVSYDGATRMATLDPSSALVAKATYTARVTTGVRDTAGIALASPEVWTFTMAPDRATDTTTSDFSAGTIGTDTYVSETANGEVTLRPTAGAEFSGTSVPAGWEGVPFGPGGTVVVSGGRVTVNSAHVNTQGFFSPGHSLEFIATFLPGTNAHIGFGNTFQQTPWAIFSSSPLGDALTARTNDGSNAIDHPITGNFMGTPHRYRIDWGASQVVFSIDGQVVDTQNATITQDMRPVAASGGGAPDVTVDWMRMSPYSTSGTFLSRVFDAAGDADWGAMTWTTGTPAGTTVAMSARTGNTAVPDASWSPFVPVANPGDTIGATSRFIQYRAQLATTDPDRTPELRDVTIEFGPVANHIPVAQAQSVSTTEDTATTITLAGTDADGDTLSFAIGTGPTHGSLGSIGAVGCSAGTCSANVIYTPTANYHGSDSFTFTVGDGSATSTVATVSITVNADNDAPVADDDTYTTAEGQALSVNAPGVLDGDTDADGDPLTAVGATDPAHGTLALQADGSFTYTPSGSFSGQDSFTYQASDGQAASNVATVTITVTDVNHIPVAQAQSVSATEDTATTITLAGTDADGDTLSFAIGTGPTHGSLGSIGAVGCSDGTCSANVTYTPAANYHGSDSFTFTVGDGSATSAAATVSITVNADNDAPAAQAQSVSTTEDTAKTITLAGTDADGDTLSFAIGTGPTHGSLGSIGAVGCSAGTCSANVTYTPTANYHGSDSFTFTVGDGSAFSAPATVDLDVVPVAAPIAFRSAASTFTSGTTSLSIPVPAGVQQDDVLVASIAVGGNPTITPPAGWTLVVDTPNGSMHQAAFVHVVGAAAEPSSYTWRFSVSKPAAGGMAAYSGANTAAPVAVFGGQANSRSTSITAPSVSTSEPGNMLIGMFATNAATSIGPPGSMVERTEAGTPSGGNAAKITFELSDQLLAGSGATGTRVAAAGAAAVNIGITIALGPAVGGPTDEDPPTVPDNVLATASSGRVDVSWDPSQDTVGVDHYTVFRERIGSGQGPLEVGTSPTPSFADTNVQAETTYVYTVTASDAAGNTSAPSDPSAPVTTPTAPTAPIAFRSAASTFTSGTTSLSIPVPAGVQQDDVLVASIAVGGNPTITPPAGWTLVVDTPNGSMHQAAFVHVVGAAAEPSSYTWRFSVSKPAAGGMAAYSGANTAAPVAVFGGQANSRSTSITAPSVSTSEPGNMLIGMFATNAATSIGPPGSMVERTEAGTPSGGNAAKITFELSDQLLAGSGATGTRVAAAGAAAVNIGITIALRPAGG